MVSCYSILLAATVFSLTQAIPSRGLEGRGSDGASFDPSTFCRAGETTVTAPFAFALYPTKPEAVFDIVGDFFNISWIGLTLSKTEGPDNTPGSKRFPVGDPFVNIEELTHYYVNRQTFRHKQVVKTAAPVILANATASSPAYIEAHSHVSVAIQPMCGGKAALFGFKSTFCTTGPAPEGFDVAQDLFAGASGALERLWTTELGLTAPFNSTPSCASVHN